MATLPSLPFDVLDLVCRELHPRDARALALVCRALHHVAALQAYTRAKINSLDGWLSFCKGVAADPRRAHRTKVVQIVTPSDFSFPPDDPTDLLSHNPVLLNVDELDWRYHPAVTLPWRDEPLHGNTRVGTFFDIFGTCCPNVCSIKIQLPASTDDYGHISVVPPNLRSLRLECVRPSTPVMPLLRACGANLREIDFVMRAGAGPLGDLGEVCPLLETVILEAPGATIDFDPPPLQLLLILTCGAHALAAGFLRRRFPGLRRLLLTVFTVRQEAGDRLLDISDAISWESADPVDRWPSLQYLSVDVKFFPDRSADDGQDDEDEDTDEGDETGSNDNAGDNDIGIWRATGVSPDGGDGDEDQDVEADGDQDGGASDDGDGDGDELDGPRDDGDGNQLSQAGIQALTALDVWAEANEIDFDYSIRPYYPDDP